MTASDSGSPVEAPNPSPPPGAGWLVEPHNPDRYRYWDGTRWTDHFAPRVWPSPEVRRDRRTSGLGQAAIWAAVAWTVLTFAQLPFLPHTENAVILDLFAPSEVAYYLMTGLEGIAALTAYVLTCAWLWRCRANVTELRTNARQRRGAAWVWASWVTPVVSWWFPYQVVNDIGTANDANTVAARRPPGIGLWWGSFLGMQFAGLAIAVLHLRGTSWTQWWFEAAVVEAVITFTALALWIRVVRYIEADQAALAATSVSPRRRLAEVTVASAAAALLLSGLGFAATTTTASPPTQTEPDGPRFEMPAVGDCHSLSSTQVTDPSDESASTPCTAHHTTMTYDVGFIAGEIEDFRGETCSKPRLDKALGLDHRLTFAAWTYYVPTVEQEEHGARWYRCDVYLESHESDRLLALPAAFPLIKAKASGSSPFVSCSTELQGSEQTGKIVRCSEEHAYEAVAVATLVTTDRWPGEEKVDYKAFDACEAAVSPADRGDFLYLIPTRKEWEQASEVPVICYARDGSHRQVPSSDV